MNTHHKSLVAIYLESGFYTAYQDSHGAELQEEDLENDCIERDSFNDDAPEETEEPIQ